LLAAKKLTKHTNNTITADFRNLNFIFAPPYFFLKVFLATWLSWVQRSVGFPSHPHEWFGFVIYNKTM
jgi:hypothetical protein